MTEAIETSAQMRFDEKYVSTAELVKTLGVNRASIFHARQRGMLPDPIVINDGQLYLWERVTIAGIIEEWKRAISFRKNPSQFLTTEAK
jgi:predicted DNA-binding transcriptional regulator AlpA